MSASWVPEYGLNMAIITWCHTETSVCLEHLYVKRCALFRHRDRGLSASISTRYHVLSMFISLSHKFKAKDDFSLDLRHLPLNRHNPAPSLALLPEESRKGHVCLALDPSHANQPHSQCKSLARHQ